MDGEGWFYNCCPRCARKVRAVDGTYYCDNCAKETNDFKPRYKIIVHAQDKSGTTTFTLFNKEAEQLIGVPIENIISTLPEDSPTNDIPAVIKNIIGKKCAFDIKINAYNTERGYEDFTVFRLTDSAAAKIQDGDNQAENTAKKKQKLA